LIFNKIPVKRRFIVKKQMVPKMHEMILKILNGKNKIWKYSPFIHKSNTWKAITG